MSKIITQNYWRHFQPEAPNLRYGVKPDGKIYVKLREELTQGVRPFDEETTASFGKQMGYSCEYIVDIAPDNGVLHHDEDGRGFWYVPIKGFTGEDVLSYRIVNVMNQSSEPGCITFEVTPEVKIGRIEPVIEKIKTTILQGGDNDAWFETDASRAELKEREIYVYNTVPDGHYTLTISGYYRALYWVPYYYDNGYPVRYRAVLVSRSIDPVFIDLYRAIDFADYDVFKFTAQFNDQLLGVPDGWPNTYKGYSLTNVEYTIGFNVIPAQDVMNQAEISNRLIFTEKDYAVVDRTISNKVRDRLGDKSTYHAQIAPEIKSPVFLINGYETVGVSRLKRHNRLLDLTGKTLAGDADAGVTVQVGDMEIHSPFPNSRAFNETVWYKDANGEDRSANVMKFYISLSDIPAVGGSFALVAHVPDLTSVFNVPDFHPEFLARDADDKFVKGTDYQQLLVLEVFTSDSLSEALATETKCIIRRFTANVEYLASLETCREVLSEEELETLAKDELPAISIYPIDFNGTRGITFVPYSDGAEILANENFLSSTFVPFVGSQTYEYPKKLANTTRQVAFYGDEYWEIKPAMYVPEEFKTWEKHALSPAQMYFTLERENKAPLRAFWRAVPIPNFSAETLMEEVFDAVELHSKSDAYNDWLTDRIQQTKNGLVVYEHKYANEEKDLNLHKSAYHEVLSLRDYTKLDGATSGEDSETFAIVLDIVRMLPDFYTNYPLKVCAFDATTGQNVTETNMLFDAPELDTAHLLGLVTVKQGKPEFLEKHIAVEPRGDIKVKIIRDQGFDYDVRTHLVLADDIFKRPTQRYEIEATLASYIVSEDYATWRSAKRFSFDVATTAYTGWHFEASKDYQEKTKEDYPETAIIRRRVMNRDAVLIKETEAFLVVAEVKRFTDSNPTLDFGIRVEVVDAVNDVIMHRESLLPDVLLENAGVPLLENRVFIPIGIAWVEDGRAKFESFNPSDI